MRRTTSQVVAYPGDMQNTKLSVWEGKLHLALAPTPSYGRREWEDTLPFPLKSAAAKQDKGQVGFAENGPGTTLKIAASARKGETPSRHCAVNARLLCLAVHPAHWCYQKSSAW